MQANPQISEILKNQDHNRKNLGHLVSRNKGTKV